MCRMKSLHTVLGALLILRIKSKIYLTQAISKCKGSAPDRLIFSTGRNTDLSVLKNLYILRDLICCGRKYFKFKNEFVRTDSSEGV